MPLALAVPAATAADAAAADPPVGLPANGALRWPAGTGCSMNATCRHEFAVNAPVLSYDMPSRSKPDSGTAFHSLQATSQALQPMQTLVSVKNPIRGRRVVQPASGAGSSGPYRLLPSGMVTRFSRGPSPLRPAGRRTRVVTVGGRSPGTIPARRR